MYWTYSFLNKIKFCSCSTAPNVLKFNSVMCASPQQNPPNWNGTNCCTPAVMAPRDWLDGVVMCLPVYTCCAEHPLTCTAGTDRQSHDNPAWGTAASGNPLWHTRASSPTFSQESLWISDGRSVTKPRTATHLESNQHCL